MGKKTRKTRWRTLSLNGPQSDSESQNGEFWSKSGDGVQHHGRSSAPWHQQGTRYRPRHSTSPRQHSRTAYKYETSKSTTRSSSITSDNKITFNEDEYTRITTPRQDVLFKKGYLSKPKPYLMQQQTSLTSTGNSTGDGTPDHQSAGEAAECNDVEPFFFPAPSGFLEPSSVYFINGFDAYQPFLVYNPGVCYPPPPPVVMPRTKRYSTDSLPESNGCKEDLGVDEDDGKQDEDVSPNRTTTRKKRRRLKTKSVTQTDAQSSEDGEQSDDVIDTALTPPPAPAENYDNIDKTSISSPPPATKYRVDAEEFVPRAYRPVPSFVPVYGPFMPGVPIGYVPPPEFFLANGEFVASQTTYECDDGVVGEEDDESHEADEVELENDATETQSVQNQTPSQNNAIDIAKIVSRLEQAALEQRQQEQQEQLNVVKETQPPPPPISFSTIVEKNNSSPKLNDVIKHAVRSPLKTTLPKTTATTETKPKPKHTKKPTGQIIVVEPKRPETVRPAVAVPNQWISVSSKKKRRGKQRSTLPEEFVEDFDATVEDVEEIGNVEELVVESIVLPVVPVINEPVTTETENKVDTNHVTETEQVEAEPEVLDESAQVKSAKKKKRKKKSKQQQQPTSTSSPDSELVPESKTNIEVCQEIDEMILRGLYANLEEKIKSFNPSDSFIRSVNGNGVIFKPPSFGTNGFKRFDNMLFGCTKPLVQQSAVTPKLNAELVKEGVPEMPITRAVKEWIDRAREKTPEVEIFKKPAELRNEFLVMDDSDDALSSSPDLLDCWEPETAEDARPERTEPSPTPSSVDAGEDALEMYESVYGTGADYQRIRSEVRSACAANGNARFAPRDGGLPYRAICCTIM